MKIEHFVNFLERVIIYYSERQKLKFYDRGRILIPNLMFFGMLSVASIVQLITYIIEIVLIFEMNNEKY